MSFLLANWKLFGAAIAVAALFWVGWIVKGKFERAADADRLESQVMDLNQRLREQVSETRAAEERRVAVSKQLAEAEATSAAKTKEVIRVVRQTVRDDRSCDVPVGVLRALNETRGGDVPSPAE